MTVGEDLKKIAKINMEENKKLLKLISDVVYDTVQYMKDDFVIYEHEPTIETSNDGDNVNVYLDAHEAFIDEEYIVDNIYYNITGEDSDGVRQDK